MIINVKYFLMPAILLYGFLSYSQSNYKLADDYTFIIRGSSNIRDWSQSVDEVDGIAGITMPDEAHFDIDEISILIRANAIKSIGVEGTAMNRKTYETLKTTQYPTITFTATEPVNSIPANGKKSQMQAEGMLTIAGTSKKIILHPTVSADRNGRITVKGDVFLKMSDFNIDPPVTLFGLLRVTDHFAVHFKITLVPGTN